MPVFPYGISETKVRRQAEVRLSSLGLSWESDVEEVIPVTFPASRQFLKAFPHFSTTCYVTKVYSSSQVIEAAKQVLESWDIVRSCVIDDDEGLPILLTLRCTARYLDNALVFRAEVDTEDDLENVSLGTTQRQGELPEGLLLTLAVLKVKDTGACALAMNESHAITDAVMGRKFLKDITELLNGRRACEKVQWSLFANIYRCYSLSLPAEEAIAFHSKRLQGIHTHYASLWPQPNPEMLDRPLGPQGKERAFDLGYAIHCSKTLHCRTFGTCMDQAIRPAIIVKAAIALFNCMQTGTLTALIGVALSGRSWPFTDEALSHYLPDPKLIAGPTLSLATEIIHINLDETLHQFLARLTREQALLTRYQHCPLRILDQLSPEDRLVWSKRKQIFNWLPYDVKSGTSLFARNISGFETWVNKPTQATDPLDEFTWRCGLVDGEHLGISASAGSQFFDKESLLRIVEEVFEIVGVLADPGQWNESAGEVRAAIMSRKTTS